LALLKKFANFLYGYLRLKIGGVYESSMFLIFVFDCIFKIVIKLIQKVQLSTGKADRTAYVRCPASDYMLTEPWNAAL